MSVLSLAQNVDTQDNVPRSVKFHMETTSFHETSEFSLLLP